MQVLHLVADLNSASIVTPVGLLGKHLAGTMVQRIVSLGAPGMESQGLGLTSPRIDFLNWTRAFDPAPLWRLRRLLHAEPPDLIHVWGLAALRCLGLVGRRWLPRTLFNESASRCGASFGRLDRWLLARVGAIVATSHAEADAYQHAGFPDVTVIRPGIASPLPLGERRKLAEPVAAHSPRHAVHRILCLGDPKVRGGFRDALWALDMLHYVFQQARLTIASSAALRPYLRWFTEQLEIAPLVEFLDEGADLAEPRAQADVCWAPTSLGVTQQTVLEAMAAGRPVIVADEPALREIVADQETGYLTPDGDKVTLCKRTRGLFLDAELALRMGDAARRRAAIEFSAEAFAANWSEQYTKAA